MSIASTVDGEPRTGVRRRGPSPTSVVVTGLVLVALATAFRVWAIRPAWFFYDDFFFIQQARDHGLTASYLFQPYNGHLMPASWLLTWVNTRLEPFGFAYPAVEIIVLFALAGLGFLRLVVTLFGARWATLVPLVLFLFSPILLPATLWWAAAVNQLPMLVALAFGLTSFVRHLRERSTRDLVVSMIWLAFGLAFVERSLVILFVMWLVAVLYFAAGTLPERLQHVWHTYRRAVVSHGVLVAAYLAAYVPYAMNFDATSITQRPLFGVLGNLAGIALPSGFAGGPLRWHQSDVTQSEAHPPQGVLILCWLVLGLVVLASVRTRRRGARAWLLPVSVVLVNSALIAASRAIFFGAEVALDYRFQTELALIMALAVGLAFLPVVGAVESAEPSGASWGIDGRGTVLPACAIFVVAAVASTSSFPLRNLTTTNPQTYVENVAASARAAPGTQILDLPTPKFMWAEFAYPTNLASYMLRPYDDLIRFRASTTDQASRIDARGNFVPLVLDESRQQSAPDSSRCFTLLSGGRTTWSLDGPVVGVVWFVRLEYDAPARTQLSITVDGATRKATLEKGQHYLVSPAPGTYSSVSLAVPDGSDPVCLQHLGIAAIRVD